MKLVVFSIKRCWYAPDSPSGFSTDGGFLYQMSALSELFDQTTVVVPCLPASQRQGDAPLTGHNLRVVPLPYPPGFAGWRRKVGFPLWLLRALPVIRREMRRADAVHAPIPGDLGTVGMVLAARAKKPLLVRHCGNWFVQNTKTERFIKRFMEKHAGGRNVMLATGGASEPPSKNPNVRWIYSTSLSRADIESAAQPRTAPPVGRARLVIACRQTKAKGTGVVLEALPALRALFPEVHFDVLGDGSHLKKFQAQARSLGVDDITTFHGQVAHTRVVELMRNADLFCFPTSSSEGFPKVVVEALAAGLPVITTRVSVLPQVIAHGCGVLLDEVTPDAIVTSVKNILASPDGYETMSRHALETARLYTLEGWGEQIGAWCEEAWGQPLRAPTAR